MSNKEQILRNLEYISGGITAIKCMVDTTSNWACLCEEWNDSIWNTIGLIEEDYEKCQKPLKSLPQ